MACKLYWNPRRQKNRGKKGQFRIWFLPIDHINPSQGHVHWQDISKLLGEKRVPTLCGCKEALLGPLVVFAHLWKCRTPECCWRTQSWHYARWLHMCSRCRCIKGNKISNLWNACLWVIPCPNHATTHQKNLGVGRLERFDHTGHLLLSSDIKNICRKRAEDPWEKHLSDPISVRMWAAKNQDNVFYYQEHLLMDLNSQTQYNSPFTIGIQTEWQLKMMAKFGHNCVLSIDATSGTNHTRVR